MLPNGCDSVGLPTLRLTPCTWAASVASLVVSAPTLFLGLSNQPRSYTKTGINILVTSHFDLNVGKLWLLQKNKWHQPCPIKSHVLHQTIISTLVTSPRFQVQIIYYYFRAYRTLVGLTVIEHTCLIMDLKAFNLSFRVKISPDLPKQKPCKRFIDRRH